MIVTEVSPKRFSPITAAQRTEVEEKIKKMRKEGEKMVKGMFEFVDAQGGWLDFSYRFFPGEPIRCVKIIHGEIVDVPMILAKHLNNVYAKIRMPSPELDESGRALKQGSITRRSRTRFTPVDMM
jgi:hypothetical protein